MVAAPSPRVVTMGHVPSTALLTQACHKKGNCNLSHISCSYFMCSWLVGRSWCSSFHLLANFFSLGLEMCCCWSGKPKENPGCCEATWSAPFGCLNYASSLGSCWRKCGISQSVEFTAQSKAPNLRRRQTCGGFNGYGHSSTKAENRGQPRHSLFGHTLSHIRPHLLLCDQPSQSTWHGCLHWGYTFLRWLWSIFWRYCRSNVSLFPYFFFVSEPLFV